MIFEEESVAMRVMTGMMMGKQDEFVNAAKNGQIVLNGPDSDAMWFSGLLLKVFAFDVIVSEKLRNKNAKWGSTLCKWYKRRSVFVYVKDGKIVRMTPMDLDEDDAESWTIRAKGKKFTPPRRTTVAPYAFWKSLIYSDKRVLYL